MLIRRQFQYIVYVTNLFRGRVVKWRCLNGPSCVQYRFGDLVLRKVGPGVLCELASLV